MSAGWPVQINRQRSGAINTADK